MFDFVKNMFLHSALNKVREKMINPRFEGIGTVEELSFKGKELFLIVKLAGLEDRPIDVTCSDIKIAADGGAIQIGKFVSNMAFVENALQSFLCNRPLEIPEGAARAAAQAAKKMFGL